MRSGLETVLRLGNGTAILRVLKRTEAGEPYSHFVTAREVRPDGVLIHDPEVLGPEICPITDSGFGTYKWTGDTILAQ
jgi:hypothetical protein